MSKDLDNAMTKQSLDERIDTFLLWVAANRDVHARRWSDEIEPELKRQYLQTLKDVITEVTPEKKNLRDLAYELGNGIATTQAQGYNHAIDQVHTNLNNLLGENQ